MKVCVLGSGSGGNCTYVEAGGYRLLIDAGRLGQRYIKKHLLELGTSIDDIDGIVATHMHGDHVDTGVTLPLCKNHEIPLYIHNGSYNDLVCRSSRFINLEQNGLLRRFDDDGFFPRENISVVPFHVQHGGNGWSRDYSGRPVGFRVTHHDNGETRTLAFTTDLGMADERIAQNISDANVIIIESNHDREMEKKSSRHRSLVNWVLSPWGHLSNEEASWTLARAAELSETPASHVVLAHLSCDCNDPELAFNTAVSALENVCDNDVKILVSSQKSPTEIITI